MTKKNRIRFGDLIINQYKGIAMGMAAAPTITIIYVAIIENEHGEQEEESENFECDVEDTLNTEEKTIDILVSRSFYYTVSE